MDKNTLQLNAFLNEFPQKNVLLIGDTIVDHYVYGTLLGTSAETPTIVAKEMEQTFTLGGAFLVCRNLLSLNGKVQFITLIGEDRESDLIRHFSHPNLTMLPFTDDGRKVTVKRRYWVDGYKLLQFDQLDDRPLEPSVGEDILREVERRLPRTHSLIISDYRHGLLTKELIHQLIGLAKKANKPIFVDSQVSQKASNHMLYQGASLICLNRKEALCVDPDMGNEVDFEKLFHRLKASHIVVKDGEKGSIASIGGKIYRTPAYPVNVVDTCGAGDAFLAALSLGDLERPEISLSLANLWAGLSTAQKGPHPPNYATFLEQACYVRT